MDRIGLAVIPSEHSHPAPQAHPERLEKLKLALEALEQPEMRSLVEDLPVRSYETAVLERIHTPGYIKRLITFTGSGYDYLDPDTYRTSTSFAASCEVTWAVLSGLDEAFGNGPKASFIIGRPPGHHAETDTGMGFCLVNHIAVAVQYAQDRHYCQKVAVVDFDVHHGNGTQHLFYERNDVLYISTHQYPFYPGTGSREERGQGKGAGYTLNCPFSAGAGDDEMISLFEGEIFETVQNFRPDCILVSAGFDGHRLDPLGGFNLTGKGFFKIAAFLKTTALGLCEGRLVSLLEGGYSPDGNRDAITSYIKGLTI